MARKTRAVKKVRKSLADKLSEARFEANRQGFEEGRAHEHGKFLPDYKYRSALDDFVRLVKSWPIDGAAVVMLVGTDLKHIVNAAIPARTAKAIATELERLGYGQSND